MSNITKVNNTFYPRSYRNKSFWWEVPKKVNVTQSQKDKEIEAAYRRAKGE